MNTLFKFSLVFILTSAVCQISNAQRNNIQKGGTPGQETNWACSKNWSLCKVPDVFQNVIIPDVSTRSQKYPIIKSGSFRVNQLHIYSGARLTINDNAQIVVNDLKCQGTCIDCKKNVWIIGELATALTINSGNSRIANT